MINSELDEKTRILHVVPTGPLRAEDFERLASKVDPVIEKTGGLAGLILELDRFPGWADLGSLVRHIRFVRNHHRKIKRVAVVTDIPLADLAQHIAAHFASPEFKHFPHGQIAAARAWITGETPR